MSQKKRTTKKEAWLSVLIGLFLGTVFIFGVRFWNAPIAEEDAIHTTAVFSSCEETRRRGNLKQIIIRTEDDEQMYIDGVCITAKLRDAIHRLTPGTLLSLTVHPNSNCILAMRTEHAILMEFWDSSQRLTDEANGFQWLGLFCYGLAVYGLVSLLRTKKR